MISSSSSSHCSVFPFYLRDPHPLSTSTTETASPVTGTRSNNTPVTCRCCYRDNQYCLSRSQCNRDVSKDLWPVTTCQPLPVHGRQLYTSANTTSGYSGNRSKLSVTTHYPGALIYPAGDTCSLTWCFKPRSRLLTLESSNCLKGTSIATVARYLHKTSVHLILSKITSYTSLKIWAVAEISNRSGDGFGSTPTALSLDVSVGQLWSSEATPGRGESIGSLMFSYYSAGRCKK